MATNKRRDNTKTWRDNETPHTSRSLHPPEQSALHCLVQFGRGHLSGHLSAQDSHDRSVQCSHARQKTRQDKMDLACYSHDGRLVGSG